ncbi:MAG: alpha/beta hydrolase [Myxococcales bacterium]|nr:alpha/beta hydrolase [Myxococcales bacterium]
MRLAAWLSLSPLLLLACGDDSDPPTGSATGAGGGPSATTTVGSGATGTGGAQTTGSSTGTGQGGGAPTALQDLLARLRDDRDGTLLEESFDSGWPVLVDEGRVVVSTEPALSLVAGDFDAWAGTPLTADQGFSWGILPDQPGSRYKLTDGTTFEADPWARAYDYDQFGEITMIPPATAHLERYFQVEDSAVSLEPRTVRVWLPEGTPTHVLYVHDGQNLFDPFSAWGGWHLQESVPAGMMLVGIDNTPARMDEYTHVADDLGSGPIGGLGDEYAALLEDAVRPLIASRYGEPQTVGLMGSSLGGLISLHVAYLNPTDYAFAASLSGTVGWGSIGPHTGETLIERFEAAGAQPFAVFLDSGGNGPCADSDGDGIDDDGAGADNYCENIQLRDTLDAAGYTFDVDLFHWHEPGAEHNEAAWAARVFRPMQIFAGL